MKNWIIVLLIFVMPLSLYAYLDAKAQSDMMCSVEQEKAIKTEKKAKLIKFSSPMCSECKQVKEQLDNVSSDVKNNIIIEEIDVLASSKEKDAYNKQMIKKYNVTLVPTLIFLDKDGNIVTRKENVVSTSELTKIINEIK